LLQVDRGVVGRKVNGTGGAADLIFVGVFVPERVEAIDVGAGQLGRLVEKIEPEDGGALLEASLGEAEAQTPNCTGANDCGGRAGRSCPVRRG